MAATVKKAVRKKPSSSRTAKKAVRKKSTSSKAKKKTAVKKTATYPSPNPKKGKACLVFFYTGDSYVTRLCQETVNLSKLMSGYKKVVLLKHSNAIGPIDLTAQAVKKAHVVATPTKTNFVKYIKELAKEGYYMDLFIIGHGNKETFVVSKGKNGTAEKIDTSYVESNLSSSKTGLKVLPIRMVYQGICYGSTWNDTWKKLGAKISVGSRYVNFYPNQMGRFASEWNKGRKVSDSLKNSNTGTSRTLVQIYILADAKLKKKKWGGCPFPQTVLGKKSCAKNYFKKIWKISWKSGKSGKENMNYSSAMMRQGNTSITKKTVPKW